MQTHPQNIFYFESTFGSPIAARAYASGEYRFGFNGQESVDEIKGIKSHYTAQFWEYDPRVVTRWNQDPVKAAWESPYVISRNNPIALNDPDGDCSTCPPPSVSGNITARINIGGTGGASGSIGFGLGVTGQTGSNFALGGGASGSFNFGGLGSSSHTPDMRFDFGLTLTGTVGSGTAGPQSLQTINSQIPSGIMNTFQRSGTFGANLILGSDNRNQGTGYLGFRRGDFSAGHSNDFFFGMTDHYWGAETNIKIGSETGPNMAIWNEVYNGKRVLGGNNPTPNKKANYQSNDWFGRSYDVMLVKQDARDISLNSGRTHATFNMPTKTGGTITLGVGGEGGLHMAPQRWLHFGRQYPQFEHDKRESKPFVISGFSAF